LNSPNLLAGAGGIGVGVGVGGGVVGHGGAAGIGMWRELRCGWLRLQALGLNRQQAGAAAQRHDR
jgi:hypothetical protein